MTGDERRDFEVGHAVRRAWALLWENATILIGATIMGVFLMGIINLPVTILAEEFASIFPGVASVRSTLGVMVYVIEVFFGLLGYLVQTYFILGMSRLYLKVARGEPIEFYDILVSPRQFAVGLGASILYALAVMVGLLACVLPSLIVVVLLYFWNFVVVDQEKGSLGVLQESARLVLFAPGPVCLVFLVSGGLVLLGLMACCVGVFVAAPLTGLCWAQLYLWISGEAPPLPNDPGLLPVR